MSGLFYQYRIYLFGASVISAYRQESNELELWDSVISLRGTSEGFTYFYFDTANNIIPGIADPTTIVNIDRPWGIKPVDLDEKKRQIEEAKARASERQVKTLVGSRAIDITKGK